MYTINTATKEHARKRSITQALNAGYKLAIQTGETLWIFEHGEDTPRAVIRNAGDRALIDVR